MTDFQLDQLCFKEEGCGESANDKSLSGQHLILKLLVARLTREENVGRKKDLVNMMIKWILFIVNYSIPE